MTCCIGNSVNRKEFDSLPILQLDCDKPVIVVEEWVEVVWVVSLWNKQGNAFFEMVHIAD